VYGSKDPDYDPNPSQNVADPEHFIDVPQACFYTGKSHKDNSPRNTVQYVFYSDKYGTV
jgi:hypothetical protein